MEIIQQSTQEAERARQRTIRNMEATIDRCLGPQPTDAQLANRYGGLDEENQMSTGITIDPTARSTKPETMTERWLRDAQRKLRLALENGGEGWRAAWIAGRR